MKKNRKWNPQPQPSKPSVRVVWDEFDAEAARDGAAIQRAHELRPKRPKRVK